MCYIGIINHTGSIKDVFNSRTVLDFGNSRTVEPIARESMTEFDRNQNYGFRFWEKVPNLPQISKKTKA